MVVTVWDLNFSGRICPEDIIDANFQTNDEEEQNNNANNAEERRPRRQRIRTRAIPKPMDFAKCNRHSGAKKCRRQANTLQLIDSVGRSIDDIDDVSIEDFISSGVSAFSKIIENAENIKIWNNFINCSDDDQYLLLIESSAVSKSNDEQFSAGKVPRKQQLKIESDGKICQEVKDQDGNVPGNPDLCFRKINSRFRALIRKKHLPLGKLSHLEEEITGFFLEWPKEVCLLKLTDSYERFVLHSLCQYLDLLSGSYFARGERKTKVENPHKIFQLPSMLLTEYIEKHFKL